MSELLLLLGIGIVASSGAVGLLLSRRSNVGQWVTTVLAAVGSGVGLAGIGMFWATGHAQPIVLPWPIPGAEFSVAVDGLSAIFLLPIFLISLVGNVYGLGYWKQTEHPANGRKLRFFYATVTAGMALLVIARNGILFLFGWEIMALSAFFLVTTEDHDQEVRETGWMYLVATHVGTLCLFGVFALLRAANGSFALTAVRDDALTPFTSTALFVLALLGFGIKAGIMPLHVWLPSAHAVAPSHVSALMSGVLIKMGIYGLVRVLSLLPQPPLEWGAMVLGLGVVSGVLGVAFAIGQHDFKRLLAYHSIENIGIIVMGLGLALIGRSLGHDEWVILGLSGALLHVVNHALFKALLFLSAGSVIHAVHTREIDRLGGLARSMPRTALFFLVGAVAICGLPPLNGFVSEFLIYLGLFDTVRTNEGPGLITAVFAVPALALIGSLAVACFVKVFGAVFLGTARSQNAVEAHESPFSMIAPMGVLAAGCFFIGLAPPLVAPALAQAVTAWAPELPHPAPRMMELAPLGWVSAMAFFLVSLLLLVSGLLWLTLRRGVVEQGATWGCGYVAPTPRMQYTSSSFGQMLVGLFAWALRPRVKQPANLPVFPRTTNFHSEVPDTVLDGAVLPAFRFTAWALSWFRVFQQGSIQAYLLYIFLTLLTLLLWR